MAFTIGIERLSDSSALLDNLNSSRSSTKLPGRSSRLSGLQLVNYRFQSHAFCASRAQHLPDTASGVMLDGTDLTATPAIMQFARI